MIYLLNKKEIYLAYVSKKNSNCEKQFIILMGLNGKGCKAKSKKRWWHCLAVKKLPALFSRITSKNNGDLYCLDKTQTCLLKTPKS